MNGLMGNLMNSLTNHLGNHLVSGLAGSNLANAGGLPLSSTVNSSAVGDLIGSAATSEAEDNLDHMDSQQTPGSLTCNGTQAVSVSSNSNNIGKC